MAGNKTVRLSEPTVWAMKYMLPLIIVFFVLASHGMHSPQDQSVDFMLCSLAFLYWLFRLIHLKEVKLDGDYLVISGGLKKDKVHLNEIDKLKTGYWPMYLTRVYFKHETKFGKKITFSTMQNMFSMGVSKGVKNIFNQIQVHIEQQKKTEPNNIDTEAQS